ncbi:MAG: class I SAM-dependent methyltransferase [Planctomycetota bacterium]
MKNAKTRHKHDLYQESVQNPEFEAPFLQRVYRAARKKKATRFQEDFCGTAVLLSEWVKRNKDGIGRGVDLHAPTLKWGRSQIKKNLNEEQRSRIDLLEANVLDPSDFKPDITAALNFSYFIFKERPLLKSYFERVREDLADEGIFVLDIYGGPEAQKVQEDDPSEREGFFYVWDQAHFNPITGDYRCHIHFEFEDGGRKKKAFTYDWRLWTLPEIIDLLREVGFEEPLVYWEGTDEKTGSGNDEFNVSKVGDDSDAWIAYVVAPK